MYKEGNRDTRHGLAIASGYNNASGTNRAIDFFDGDYTLQGSITFQQGTVQYGAFTANHDVELPNADNDAGYDYGTLLEITELFYKTQKDGTEFVRGIRYKVRKSSSAYSKSVLGAYAGKYDLIFFIYIVPKYNPAGKQCLKLNIVRKESYLPLLPPG